MLSGHRRPAHVSALTPFVYALQTRLWEVINGDDMAGLDAMIKANPRVVFARSEDGRGPLFWAYEYGRQAMVTKLLDLGVDGSLRDKNGASPAELASQQEL